MTRSDTQPQVLLELMEALCDASRLRLARLLEGRELGVVELCEVVQMPQSTVSRHLKVLGDSGWVRSHRDGTTNLYRMTLDELSPAARRLWLLAREQTADWPAVEQDRLRLGRVLDRRERDASEFFAGAAGEWSSLRSWLYGKTFDRAALLSMLPADWTVADLGCGTGEVAAELAGYVGRVIGVDSSTAMLKAARRRVEGAANVELRRGTLDRLPVEDGECHAALMMLVLTYLPEPIETALGEAARVLRRGGRLVVVDLLKHDRDDFRRRMGQAHPGFEPDDLRQRLIAAGLTRPTCRPIPPEAEAKGPALLLATAVK